MERTIRIHIEGTLRAVLKLAGIEPDDFLKARR
jgi:hypothetical protein